MILNNKNEQGNSKVYIQIRLQRLSCCIQYYFYHGTHYRLEDRIQIMLDNFKKLCRFGFKCFLGEQVSGVVEHPY